MIGNFSAIGNRGTGAMADYVNENILSKTKFLKDCNLIVLPGTEAKIRKYAKNIVREDEIKIIQRKTNGKSFY